MLDDAFLLSLAPATLPILRPDRFDGAGLEMPLSRFAPRDRLALHRIYRDLEGLSRLWRSMGAAPDWGVLGRRAAEAAMTGGLFDEAQALGLATREEGLDGPDVRKALHDIRGGGLTVLLGTAELLALQPSSEGLARTCAAAARDHAKIMRCLLTDLDPPARSADQATKSHAIGHFVGKWDGAHVQGPAGPVTISVSCGFRGAVSARCLETASIDRVLYNLVNNAARFAVGGGVELAVRPVGRCLTRWVVCNRVGEDEEAFLAGTDLGALFAGGVTRGGNGVGLANCAEVVAQCFGLPDPTDAVRDGYLGAALRGDSFLVWFHWPAYTTHPEQTGDGREVQSRRTAAGEPA